MPRPPRVNILNIDFGVYEVVEFTKVVRDGDQYICFRCAPVTRDGCYHVKAVKQLAPEIKES